MIDTNFNFYTDAGGGDPDSTSPTLRRYHKLLWSKSLPNGKSFTLVDCECQEKSRPRAGKKVDHL